eukprot:15046553-Alexandrium_andersonii.AAC.1
MREQARGAILAPRRCVSLKCPSIFAQALVWLKREVISCSVSKIQAIVVEGVLRGHVRARTDPKQKLPELPKLDVATDEFARGILKTGWLQVAEGVTTR